MIDTVVEQVRQKLLDRSKAGIEHYGVTLNRTDYSLLQWLKEFQHELLDASNYVQVVINQIGDLIVDCDNCANRGGVYGLSQEMNCEHCQHQERIGRVNLFKAKQ